MDSLFDDTLLTQDAVLKRRRAILAEQARLAANQAGVYAPPSTTPNEVGAFTLSTGQRMPGQVLKTPTAAFLSPLIANVGQQIGQSTLDSDEADLNQRVRADAAARLAAMPTARAADPGIQPLTPNDDDGNPMPVPKEATPAYEPTLRERLEWAAGLKSSPLLSGVGDALTSDILTKEPERVAARQERQHEKEQARLEARRKQEEDLKWRTWQQQQHNQTLASIAAMRNRGGEGGGGGGGSFVKAGVDPDTGETLYFNPKTQQTVKGPRAAEAALKPLPAAQSKAYLENATALAKLDAAEAALASKGGTGFTKGIINALPGGAAALNYFDAGGTATRALVADIGSLKVHDRSGAAVTAAEFPRLKPFIPEVGDSAATVRTKLANFRREYAMAQQDIEDYASSMGYKVPVLTSHKAPSRETSGAVGEPVPGATTLRQPKASGTVNWGDLK